MLKKGRVGLLRNGNDKDTKKPVPDKRSGTGSGKLGSIKMSKNYLGFYAREFLQRKDQITKLLALSAIN